MEVEWTQDRPAQDGRYWVASDSRPCPIDLVYVYRAIDGEFRVMDSKIMKLSDPIFDGWYFAPAEIPNGPEKK